MTETNVSRSGSWRATALALQNQFEAENVLVYEGHTFKITPELIGYVNAMLTYGQTQLTILDSSSIPCLINNLSDFYARLVEKHLSAVNTLSMAWAARENEL